MTKIVKTTKGTLAADLMGQSGPTIGGSDPLTDKQAEKVAADKNQRAEELGVKARYEVHDG